MKTMCREERRKKTKMPAVERCRCVLKMALMMSWMMSEPVNPCGCPQNPEFARAGSADGRHWGSAAPVELQI